MDYPMSRGNCVDSNANQMNQNQPYSSPKIPSIYTFPGILHYLQHEWQNLEHEKQQWMIEKAELQAQLTILEGRVMSQFNLKKDLIRRIKMLEYCLRAERAKYHKLKYGVEPPPLHVEEDEFKTETENNVNPEITTNTNWKKGRYLLRQYLLEIGYTGSMINIRSDRVRYLLGLDNEDETNENNQNVNNLDEAKSDEIAFENREKKGKKSFKSQTNAILACDTEQSVNATIEFLNKQAMNKDDQDEDDQDDDDQDAIDSETEEVLSEFNFLSAHQSNTTVLNANTISPNAKTLDIGELANITANEWCVDKVEPTNQAFKENTNTLETNETMLNDVQEWSPRFVLKSHFDCVRCLKFHNKNPLLITGSEDETIKLWNLKKTPLASNKNKVSTQELEPIYTYRGHKSPVISLLIVNNQIFSGGLNGEILIWRIPENYSSIDPYDTYDPTLFVGTLDGHTDAVWSLVALPFDDLLSDHTNVNEDVVDAKLFVDSSLSTSTLNDEQSVKLICSASSDGTIKVWNLEQKTCVKTIICDENLGKPTCLAALPSNVTIDLSTEKSASDNQITNSPCSSQYLAVSYTKGSIQIHDLNSSSYAQPILVFETSTKSQYRVNTIIVHPTLNVLVSGHEDYYLRFWNYTTGKCEHEMIGHLAEITSLDIDLDGLYLLSGAHDCSVRLWNFESRRCVKETKPHIEKFSEAILDVSFHPSQKYFATCGADARAKIYFNNESK